LIFYLCNCCSLITGDLTAKKTILNNVYSLRS
jgi:hypothetical protein